ASCFRRIAAASPDGPAPTTTTSYSIRSRSICSSATAAVPGLRRNYIASRQKRECAAPPRCYDLAMSASGEREAALALLRWYVERGVDEAVGPEPANRFAPPPSSEPPEPLVAPRSPVVRGGTAAPPRALAESNAEAAQSARRLAADAETVTALAALVAGFE